MKLLFGAETPASAFAPHLEDRSTGLAYSVEKSSQVSREAAC